MRHSLVLSCIISALLISGSLCFPDYPEIRTSVDLAFFEELKYNLLEPLVLNNLTGLVIPYNISYNNSASQPSWYKQISITLSNPTINKVNLDWNATHLLELDENNNTRITIQDFSIQASIDYDLTTCLGTFKGTGSLYLVGLTAEFVLQFQPGPWGGAYLSILKAETSNRGISLQFSQWYLNALLDLGLFSFNFVAKDFLNSAISSLFTVFLNDQLQLKTQNGIKFMLGDYITSISLAGVPEIKTYGDRTRANMGMFITILNNKTGVAAPSNFNEILPEYDPFGGEFQVFASANVASQLFWVILQNNLIHAVLNNNEIPAGLPVGLTTSTIALLLPQFQKTYGDGKGIYLKVDQSTTSANQFIRDNRLICVLPIMMTFVIDTDSSRYPNEGVDHCTTCVTGLQLNMTAIFTVNLLSPDPKTIIVNVMGAQISELLVLVGQDKFKAEALKPLLNNLFAAMLPGATASLKKGIVNPLVGTLGIQGMTLKTGKNFLEFAIDMVDLTQPTIPRGVRNVQQEQQSSSSGFLDE